MLKKLLIAISILAVSLGATVAAPPPRAQAASAKLVVAFKVCQNLGGAGRCDTVYKKPNGQNFYALNDYNSWMADNATSIINVEAGKKAMVLYHENAWGTGWGTECGRQWVSNAAWYIGAGGYDGCNDDLGAVLLS